MKNRIYESVQEFNDKFCETLEKIKKSTRKDIKKGDSFDDMVCAIFIKEMEAIFISEDSWKKLSMLSNRSGSLNFNFQDLNLLEKNKVYIVKTPNGKQKWSDLLIIYNNIGLPIEFKSVKGNGNPVWNSSVPHYESLIIFLNKKGVFYCLGQHRIEEKIKECARIYCGLSHGLSEFFKEKFKSINSMFDWGVYFRPMYEEYTKFDNIIEKFENDTLVFIQNLPWNDKQQCDWSGDVVNIRSYSNEILIEGFNFLKSMADKLGLDLDLVYTKWKNDLR